MKHIAPPKQPPPDDFNLAYFVHCLAYIEQEKHLARQRVDRILRVGKVAIACLAVLLLAACTIPTVRATPEEYAAYLETVEARTPPLPTVTPGPDMSPECNIKVNFNGTEWVYHMPDGVYYERTLIEPDKGEFFACTEAEAQQAGARKALR